jgi:tetratricopeptide (TPR) repeat protein
LREHGWGATCDLGNDKQGDEPDVWRGPLGIVSRIDPDPDRQRLRQAWVADDRTSLRDLAGNSTALDRLTPPTLVLLAQVLEADRQAPAAVSVLRRGVARHLNDVWISFELASLLAKLGPGDREAAVGYYRVAHALQPGTGHDLAHLLEDRGAGDEAESIFRDLARLHPDVARDLTCFGRTLIELGKREEADLVLERALRAGRTAIALSPDKVTARVNLGLALQAQGKLDESVAAYREAIRLKPGLAEAYNGLGLALQAQGKLDEAIAAHREAIRLQPDYAYAHSNLGAALGKQGKLDESVAVHREAIRLKPDLAGAHYGLGLALQAQGKLDESVASYREAIRLKPDHSQAHYNLGNALQLQGKLDEAVAAHREAIRLRPGDAVAHYNFGNALQLQGKPDESVAAYREAIRLKPDLAEAHANLGAILHAQGKLDESVAAYREAIRLKPDLAEAHANLGFVLQAQGKLEEVLVEFRTAKEMAPPGSRIARDMPDRIREIGQQIDLADRFPGVLEGKDQPANGAEAVAFAQMAYDRAHYTAAARLWTEGLRLEPDLTNDRQAGHRYNGACAAAKAAAGQGKDDPPPDEMAKVALRRQALDWLNAEHALWAKLLESGPPQARPFIKQTLQHWQTDTDLAGVREPEALEGLPAEERGAWLALWEQVEALRKRAADAGP